VSGGQGSLFDPSTITYDSKALEAHYTPDWLAEYVVRRCVRWPSKSKVRVLEPHAGGGAFLRALQAWREDKQASATVGFAELAVDSFDLDRNCWAVRQGGAAVCDFLGTKIMRADYDVTIGNPPFSNAEDHIGRALSVSRQVVFVLPVSRLETPFRAGLYDGWPLERLVLLPMRVWPGSRHIGVFRFVRGYVGSPALAFETRLVDPVAPPD
jgi:hypothetical protein